MFYYLYNAIYNTLFENVNLIIPRLYLGNYRAALDYDFIKKHKIDLIINCTPDIPFINQNVLNKDDELLNIECIRIPVEDSLLEKDFILMEHYFKRLIPYLYEAYNNNKTILIHCYAGKQRSGIVVAGLLKKLLDSNDIDLNFNKKIADKDTSITDINRNEFYNIINYIVSKRPQVFTYGFRINFKKTYKRFFN